MDGDIYDKWGEHIDPRTPGGIRQEALRRAAVGPSAAPTMFRMWQEREDPAIRIEEITGDNEEVTQRLKVGAIKEEPIIVESDDEGREDEGEPTVTTLEKMKDLVEKIGRYQRRLKTLCDEVQGWRADLPKVFLYETGPGPAAGQQSSPGVAVAGSGPRSGIMFRPSTPHGRAPQATQTRSQSKAGPSQPPSRVPSQAPPRKRPEPERRKEVVEVQEEEEEDDDMEDEKLRQEEDRRTEQRAQRKEAQERVEPETQDGVPRKRKYTVRLEKDFDVERMVDRLLEGHNDLMNLKDILGSAPRLREKLKERLSRRLVPNVHLSVVLPREVGWTQAGTRMDWKCAACGLVDLVVKEKKCVAMMDTGAEMNIIRERDALMLGMEIDRADHGVLHGANCKAVFCGTASNVIIEIGKVRARTCFFVMPDVDHPILLDRSFMCRTETLIFNKHDGMMILLLSDPACGNYEVVTCRNMGPGSERNRPNLGSFTYLMKKRHRAYAFNDDQRGRLDVDKIPMIRIHTVPHEPWNLRGARYPNPDEEKMVVDYLDGKLRTHVAGYSSGPYASPWFCFIKPNGTLRWVQDLQRLNAVTVPDAGGLPNADALSESCAGRPIISLIDLYSGYDQFPVYPPNRLRHMIRAMQTVGLHITQPYIDDLAVKGPKEKEEDEVRPGVRRFAWRHIQDLDRVRHILGFVCNDKGQKPDVKKTVKILEWSVPFQTITDVRSFLGTCGFWGSFVKDFAAKTEHLRKLVRQHQEWVWGEDQEEAVTRMKGEFREGGRGKWESADQESTEDTPPVNGFLDQEEDVRLHIDKWALRVPSCVSYPIWITPRGYERKADLVLKRFQEEDPWGGKDTQWMMKLALAGTHGLVEEVRTIEEGPTYVEEHEQLMGGMYLLTNTLLQGDIDQRGSFSYEENKILIPEIQDDEFEEGEIKEAFRAEEYNRIYLELGLLLSCEMRNRDASDKAQKMSHLYVVRDGHLFIKRQVGNPKRIVCGRNQQLDIIAALHDDIAGGHRGVSATCAKISELFHWDGMLTMVIKYCQSCVPCQERSAQRPGEPLHPRLEKEVGAVVHLDLLFMPMGENGCNYIFDARDNLTGFVDGWVIRTKTGPVLANCIEEYYLRYPFVKEFVMDQGYSLLSDEFALRKDEVEQLTAQLAEERAESRVRQARLEAKEAEWEAKLKEMAAAVEILTAAKVIDWTKQSRYGIQGKEVQGLFGQEEATEASQQEKLGKVFLDPAEAEARKEANKGSFEFKAPTELTSQQEAATSADAPMEALT
ncbi:hypothetical protein CBR_g61321 [Chara braunii]|uniref:Integrase zinc-binding domain-containing protein n=1 Tax=Chara braunii TaxID=69332 RepID=A0A388MFH6_CHABU|nr:hypothetical protein CBR_g61321 [Chara braunii]|eukprot:GBG93239.1 hypothetical protein CBR_g61321 [Chara braunii]